jgi:hypothetical protein
MSGAITGRGAAARDEAKARMRAACNDTVARSRRNRRNWNWQSREINLCLIACVGDIQNIYECGVREIDGVPVNGMDGPRRELHIIEEICIINIRRIGCNMLTTLYCYSVTRRADTPPLTQDSERGIQRDIAADLAHLYNGIRTAFKAAGIANGGNNAHTGWRGGRSWWLATERYHALAALHRLTMAQPDTPLPPSPDNAELMVRDIHDYLDHMHNEIDTVRRAIDAAAQNGDTSAGEEANRRRTLTEMHETLLGMSIALDQIYQQLPS